MDNAKISTNLKKRLAATDFAAEGVTTVVLDDAGHLVEHYPDGTTRLLDEH
jgi:hypothetical protein